MVVIIVIFFCDAPHRSCNLGDMHNDRRHYMCDIKEYTKKDYNVIKLEERFLPASSPSIHSSIQNSSSNFLHMHILPN
jgi:hypothetical protein